MPYTTAEYSKGTEASWKNSQLTKLPGDSHGGKNLVGYSPWGRKESDMTERLHFHFREGDSEAWLHEEKVEEFDNLASEFVVEGNRL